MRGYVCCVCRGDGCPACTEASLGDRHQEPEQVAHGSPVHQMPAQAAQEVLPQVQAGPPGDRLPLQEMPEHRETAAGCASTPLGLPPEKWYKPGSVVDVVAPHLPPPLPLSGQDREDRIRLFFAAIREKLAGKAESKGYARDGDGSPLYDFVSSHIARGGDAHGLGEVVYKIVRYQAKGDLEDLEKAAAWIFLAWDAEQRREK